jgi:hypothetical protein
LEGGAAAVDETLGKGRLLLLGPDITFRAQSHGTFKLLFNALYDSTAEGVAIGEHDTKAARRAGRPGRR